MSARWSLIAAVARDGAVTLDLPHVVHVDDCYLDVPLVFGPFEGPVVAAAFAESYLADVGYPGSDRPPTITIVPLRSQ